MTELKIDDASRLSHAYIIAAPNADDAMLSARRLAASAVCSGSGTVPCGKCRDCRKAAAGIHPDIITVSRLFDDNGKQKREIAVAQIRQMIMDAYELPNEAKCKVFIIDRAETMNLNAQNAALKLLEEPPKTAMIILCTENSRQLLPTVRSRCTEIGLSGEQAQEDPEKLKLAKTYIKHVASGDRAQVLTWCCANDGMSGRETQEFFDALSGLLADMLCMRQPNPGLSRCELMRLDALCVKCTDYLKANTGVKHIFSLLAVSSIAGSGNRGTEN